MTKEELESTIANAEKRAFISLAEHERDWLIYKKLKEIEENIEKIKEAE